MAQNIQQFSPIQIKRTFEEVSNKIKQLIFEGELKPGQKLPSETQLAEMFQVGRQSVREALRLLELSGFISIQRGVNGGPIIQNTMLSKMANMYLDAFKFNRISISDITTARMEIEKSVLQLVFEKADKSDLEALKENIEKTKKKLAKSIAAYEENLDFHRILAKASKNHVLMIIVESLLSVLSNFRIQLDPTKLDRSKRVQRLHEQIFGAIQANNKELAIELLDENLREIERFVYKDLGVESSTTKATL